MKHQGPVASKSYALALKVVELARHLEKEQREYVLSKQFLRSRTAPGALIREAHQAESKADFIHKMSIALKEAKETEYWISILLDSKLITEEMHAYVADTLQEVIALLVSIIKTSKAP